MEEVVAHESKTNDLQWYIEMIREHTNGKVNMTLAEKAAKGEVVDEFPSVFGRLKDYIIRSGVTYSHNIYHFQTLAQVAVEEWAGIEKVLREIFPPGQGSFR